MSTIALQERIRGIAMYRDGDKMRPGCVASRLSTTGNVIRTETAKNALMDMARNGELKQAGDSYYRPLPAREWIVKPWGRRHNGFAGFQSYPEAMRAAL